MFWREHQGCGWTTAKEIRHRTVDSVNHFSEREEQRYSNQERSVGNSLSDGLGTCN